MATLGASLVCMTQKEIPSNCGSLHYSALHITVFLVSMGQAQGRPEPVRLCVATLENSSRQFVSPTWQRNMLIKAFERINKSKDVKKGKVPKIETLALDSS